MISKKLSSFYDEFIKDREQKKCLRALKVFEKKEKQYIWLDGKKFIDFSSNDYLGFSQLEQLRTQSKGFDTQWGLGSTSSRLLSGTLPVHQDLESKVSKWKKYEKTLFFASGYQANLGVISALADKYTTIFCDKLNHASIIDGVVLSRAKFKRYPHLRYDILEKELKTSSAERKIIISESIFSMDGDEADVSILANLAKKYSALLIIDDAHGSGIKKMSTAGVDVYLATFSKALGSFGGMVCSNQLINQYLINSCRSFTYTTAPPPFLAIQNMAAVDFVQSNQADDLRKKLFENTELVRSRIHQLNLPLIEGSSPIVAIVFGDESLTMKAQDIFFKHYIFTSAIKYPTVAKSAARIRLVCQSLHSLKDLKTLFKALDEVANLVS